MTNDESVAAKINKGNDIVIGRMMKVRFDMCADGVTDAPEVARRVLVDECLFEYAEVSPGYFVMLNEKPFKTGTEYPRTAFTAYAAYKRGQEQGPGYATKREVVQHEINSLKEFMEAETIWLEKLEKWLEENE